MNQVSTSTLSGIINTELTINKNTAIKMAAEHFFKNKRTTKVIVYANNVNVTLTYTGSRKDELEIRNNILITKVFKKK